MIFTTATASHCIYGIQANRETWNAIFSLCNTLNFYLPFCKRQPHFCCKKILSWFLY